MIHGGVDDIAELEAEENALLHPGVDAPAHRIRRIGLGSAHPAGRELLAEPGECRTHDIAIGDCAVFNQASDVGFEHVCSIQERVRSTHAAR